MCRLDAAPPGGVAPHTMHPLLILALGNTLLGDDGFGPHLLDHWQRHHPCPPPGVVTLDGGTGLWRCLEPLTEARHVILLDAVRHGPDPAGTLLVCPGEQIPRRSPLALSPHQQGVQSLLGLLEDLHLPLPPLTLIGVVPRSTDFGDRLSPVVQAVLPRALAALEQVLRTQLPACTSL
ncbi:MAG: hydrogenase maturation protease [Magnetococcus sp. WYHC-3]